MLIKNVNLRNIIFNILKEDKLEDSTELLVKKINNNPNKERMKLSDLTASDEKLDNINKRYEDIYGEEEYEVDLKGKTRRIVKKEGEIMKILGVNGNKPNPSEIRALSEEPKDSDDTYDKETTDLYNIVKDEATGKNKKVLLAGPRLYARANKLIDDIRNLIDSDGEYYDNVTKYYLLQKANNLSISIRKIKKLFKMSKDFGFPCPPGTKPKSEPYRAHPAWDWSAPAGTPYLAIADGEIIKASYSALFWRDNFRWYSNSSKSTSKEGEDGYRFGRGYGKVVNGEVYKYEIEEEEPGPESDFGASKSKPVKTVVKKEYKLKPNKGYQVKISPGAHIVYQAFPGFTRHPRHTGVGNKKSDLNTCAAPKGLEKYWKPNYEGTEDTNPYWGLGEYVGTKEQTEALIDAMPDAETAAKNRKDKDHYKKKWKDALNANDRNKIRFKGTQFAKGGNSITVRYTDPVDGSKFEVYCGHLAGRDEIKGKPGISQKIYDAYKKMANQRYKKRKLEKSGKGDEASQVTIEPVSVKKGQIIGHIGNSGRSTGPHMHLQITGYKESIYSNPCTNALGAMNLRDRMTRKSESDYLQKTDKEAAAAVAEIEKATDATTKAVTQIVPKLKSDWPVKHLASLTYDELFGEPPRPKFDDLNQVKESKKFKLSPLDNELDEFVEIIDERKKRRKKRKSKKPKPNKYQRVKYKARAGTRRGDTMARLSNKIKKGKKLTKADYKARDDSEAAERKKKGYKTKQRYDTGMYISEAKKKELDKFVEMIYERKKRRKKAKKKADGGRSVKFGADKNFNVTRMDFLPDAVLKKIASEKKLDEFVNQLDEKKKRKSKKKKSSAGKLSAKTKETLKKKAKRRGLTPSSVYAEYRKGLAAYYSSGSRKGMSAHQWAHARVNSANPSKSWAVVKKAKGGKKK